MNTKSRIEQFIEELNSCIIPDNRSLAKQQWFASLA